MCHFKGFIVRWVGLLFQSQESTVYNSDDKKQNTLRLSYSLENVGVIKASEAEQENRQRSSNLETCDKHSIHNNSHCNTWYMYEPNTNSY